MLITTGRVDGDSIKVDIGTLPEGAKVTVLVPEDGETFELDPGDEGKLLAAIAEADGGALIDARSLFEKI
jgi:hypothetical protein